MLQVIVIGIVQNYSRICHSGSETDDALSYTLKQIWCANAVSRNDVDPRSEVPHCSHRRLTHKGFEVAPE
ncbi:hypothetical protein TNCV_361101 [Trichonephila clavipes]|nr:hypothetical protein TNCV_361101 [Trichonephila clavipes]